MFPLALFAAAEPPGASSTSSVTTWACGACTYENEAGAERCTICDAERLPRSERRRDSGDVPVTIFQDPHDEAPAAVAECGAGCAGDARVADACSGDAALAAILQAEEERGRAGAPADPEAAAREQRDRDLAARLHAEEVSAGLTRRDTSGDDASLAMRLQLEEEDLLAAIKNDEALARSLTEELGLGSFEVDARPVDIDVDAALARALQDEESDWHDVGRDERYARRLQEEEDARRQRQDRMQVSDRELAERLDREARGAGGGHVSTEVALPELLLGAESDDKIKALRRTAKILQLASPQAAAIVDVETACLSMLPYLRDFTRGRAQCLKIPPGHPLIDFIQHARSFVGSAATGVAAVLPRRSRRDRRRAAAGAAARETVARPGVVTPVARLSKVSAVNLLVLPNHLENFVAKMASLHEAGRPSTPCPAFHGTPHPDARKGISADNFDPERCGRHDAGYYGRGTYFHTNVPSGAYTGAGSSTFFALLLKGREYALTYRLGCPLQPGFDSHIADDRRATGETVIFKRDQMIPVFLYQEG